MSPSGATARLTLRDTSTPVLDKGEVIISSLSVGGGLSNGDLEMFCIPRPVSKIGIRYDAVMAGIHVRHNGVVSGK